MGSTFRNQSQLAERLTEKFLIGRGFKIQKRNYRQIGTEIDLIANHNDTLAFVEVKFRRSGANQIDLESLMGKRKRAALKRGALSYLYETDSSPNIIRFDLSLVYPKQGKLLIKYWQNILEF